MSRARELAKAGGVQQRIAGFSSHVGMSTFLAAVHMEDNLTVDGNIGVGGNLTVTGTTTFNGGTLNLGNAATDNVVFGGEVDSNIVPDDDNTFDLGASGKEWKDLYVDGVAYLDSVESDGGSFGNIQVGETGDNEIDTESGNLTLDSAGGTVAVDDNLTVSGDATVTGGLVANGNVDLGDATSDTITATGRFDSDLVPSTDGARDLGTSALEWQDLFIDGTAHIDTLDVDENAAIIGTLDVNGSKLRVGVGNTDIIVNGDMRVTGIMSVGNGTVTIDETTVKTGSSNLHNVGIEIAGVNTLGADTPIGENATIFNNGNATFAGAITAASLDISGGVDVDGTTDLDTTNVVGTLTVTGDVAADNVTINGNTVSTSSGGLTLDSNSGTTTINDNAVISGNLTVNGTTTTINSTTVAIDDKNFQVATGAADDSAANGAGFTVESGDGNKTFNFEATGDNWGASENLNLASGKVYKINNTSVLSATTLGSGVVNSSLTTLGTISTGVWQGTAIANAYLANSTMSVGGVTLTLGGTDATPAFNLSDATNYPTSSLSGTITNAQLAGSIEGTKLENSGVSAGSYGGSSAIPVITVDAQGLVTSATTSSIDSTQIAQLNTSVACSDTGSNGLVTVTADGSTVAVFDQNLLTVTGSILPDANGTRDLGASGTRWANVYSSDLDLSNQAKGANSVDGTWGSYLIEEGEDHLFLTNRRSGKKFRFVLEEV